MPRRVLAPLALGAIAAAQSICSIQNVRIESLVNPLLLDTPAPRFSWSLSPACAAATPASWRAVVTSSSYMAGLVLWDSGAVPCNASSLHSSVAYAGAPLRSGEDFNLNLSVTLQSSVVSSNASFGMGMLTQADWNATSTWIRGFTAARCTWTLPPTGVVRGRLYVTGVGLFDLYVNGRHAQRGGYAASNAPSYFNPGFSTLTSGRLLYQALDVTSYLNPGVENVIGLRLGQGKWGYLTEFCTGGPELCNAALVALWVDDEAGGRVKFGSSRDACSGTLSSPITYNHLYIGEVYDARLEQQGWAQAGFSNASAWVPVNETTPPAAVLSAHAMSGIVAVSDTPSVSMRVLPQGGVVWDTGVNGAALFRLTLRPPVAANATLLIQVAERIANASTGEVLNTFPCPAPCCPLGGGCSTQAFNYTTAGSENEAEVYTPTFGKAGFRWVQVTVLGGGEWPAAPPAVGDLNRITLSSADEVISNVSFPTLPFLTALRDMVFITQRSSLLSHPVDCPHREARGWGGDASVTAHYAARTFALQSLYENWLRTYVDTAAVSCGDWQDGNSCGVFHDNVGVVDARNGPGQRPDCYLCCPSIIARGGGFGCVFLTNSSASVGAIPDIVPVNGPSRSFPGSMCWTSAPFVVLDALLHTYGDVRAANDSFAMLWGVLSYYNAAAAAHSGLLQHEAYGDWEGLESTTPAFMANVYFMYALQLLAGAASATGRDTEAAVLLVAAESANAAITGAYLHMNGSVYTWDTGSQTAAAAALWFELGNASLRANVAAQLAANVRAHGAHLTVGTLGSRFLLQALSESGYADVALELVQQTTAPSWGWFMTTNATEYGAGVGQAVGTLWEQWAPGGGSTSLSHGMFGGGLGMYMYEGLLGLRLRHVAVALRGEAEPQRPQAEPQRSPRHASLASPRAQRLSKALLHEKHGRSIHGEGSPGLHDLLQLARHQLLLLEEGSAQSIRLQPQATLHVEYAHAVGLESASGNVNTPTGAHVHAEWRLHKESLHMHMTTLTGVTLVINVSGRLLQRLTVLRAGVVECKLSFRCIGDVHARNVAFAAHDPASIRQQMRFEMQGAHAVYVTRDCAHELGQACLDNDVHQWYDASTRIESYLQLRFPVDAVELRLTCERTAAEVDQV